MASENWRTMSDHEKFELLKHWCESLTQAVERRGQEVNGLHQRLQKVEEKALGERKF